LEQDFLGPGDDSVDDFGTAGGDTGDSLRAIDGYAAADLQEEFGRGGGGSEGRE
jgi:hypothetical protein